MLRQNHKMIKQTSANFGGYKQDRGGRRLCEKQIVYMGWVREDAKKNAKTKYRTVSPGDPQSTLVRRHRLIVLLGELFSDFWALDGEIDWR